MNGAGAKAKLEQGETPEPVPLQSPIPQSTFDLASLQKSVGNTAVAAAVTNKFRATTFGVLQLQSTYGNAALSENAAEEQPVSGIETTPTGVLIVEDEAEAAGPGQMKKSDFLVELRSAVCDTVVEVLADTPWSEQGCPYIERWFSHYAGQDSTYIERALRKYAPETGGVTTAREYISPILNRVRRAVRRWAATGEITGAPGGLSALSAKSAAAEIPSASGTLPGTTTAPAIVEPILPKALRGGAREASDPLAIQAKLGTGRPLESQVQSQMGAALGQDFSHVQIHTDPAAGRLSSELNARAFTVGEHVAFGSSEYQPGTLVGDALIAHELAHVMQQHKGGETKGPQRAGSTAHAALEDDADRLAVSAVLAVRGGTRGPFGGLTSRTLPTLRSGLRLQRCDLFRRKEKPLTPIPEPKIGQSYEAWLKTFPEFSGSGDRNITTVAPKQLKDWIVGKLGVPPDCADVSLLLRHYYLQAQNKTFTFKAGPEGKEFKIGHGVTDEELRQCMIGLGTINFQEDRKGFRLVEFYKKGGTKLRNLKELINAGLKPGDLLEWKRLSNVHGNFEGHVQTVQALDAVSGLLTVVQGNMHQGAGVGQLQQRQYTFKDLTGADDGNADIKDAPEESFFGAGPWME